MHFVTFTIKTTPMDEKRRKYLNEYKKDVLKRIPLDVQKEYYETVLKPSADSVYEPVNTFIKKAIAERIERLNRSN